MKYVAEFTCAAALCVWSVGAHASEHSAALAQIKTDYNLAVKACTDARLPKDRTNECVKDAKQAKVKATEGEAIAEEGRKQLAAKDAAMRAAAKKQAAADAKAAKAAPMGSPIAPAKPQ